MRPDEDSTPMVPARKLQELRRDFSEYHTETTKNLERLQAELAQALATVRDMELQRDCLLHAVVRLRASPDDDYAALSALVYCELTPSERAQDADERAALDAISLDSVEEIPY